MGGHQQSRLGGQLSHDEVDWELPEDQDRVDQKQNCKYDAHLPSAELSFSFCWLSDSSLIETSGNVERLWFEVMRAKPKDSTRGLQHDLTV